MKKSTKLRLSMAVMCFALLVANSTFVFSQEGSDVSICECEVVPDATILSKKGTVRFQATISNNTDMTGTVHFGTKATKPDQVKTRWLFGPRGVYLNPYQSKSGQISHTIPKNAQEGIYIYHGYVGIPGETLFHECQFAFEVTALVGCSNCHSLYHPVDISQWECSDCHSKDPVHAVHISTVECVSCH